MYPADVVGKTKCSEECALSFIKQVGLLILKRVAVKSRRPADIIVANWDRELLRCISDIST